MARRLTGNFAYTIQGLMQWSAPETLKQDGPKPLKAGMATVDKQKEAPEYLSLVPLTVLELPEFDGTELKYADPAIRRQVSQTSGYLPYAESGYMRFSQGGTLSAKFWITVAGTEGIDLDSATEVNGAYKFTDVAQPDGSRFPVGTISIWFDLAANPDPASSLPMGLFLHHGFERRNTADHRW